MTLGLLHTKRSEKGASLMMALMVFLVCAIVASIVLTAGTAASGRLSQMREMERSYYNVTSAANVFRQVMEDGVTVNVTRSCEATIVGDEWQNPSNWEVMIDGRSFSASEGLSSANATIFELLTYDLLFSGPGNPSNNFSAARNFASGYGIEFPGVEPKPAGIDVTSVYGLDASPFVYNAVAITPSSGLEELVNSLSVTIYPNDDGTFSFQFTDNDSEKIRNPEPAVYTVVANVGGLRREDTVLSKVGTTLTWTTPVKWTYLHTTVGGI